MDYSHLFDFCNTDKQRERLRLIIEHGNPSRAAAAIGRDPANYRKLLRQLKARAAKAGIAPKDAYAAAGGWMSGRDAKVITYHKKFGEVSRLTISPDMV